MVGRLPVIASLDGLDEKALVRILSEPKNCLVNQYKKLFALDKVDLEFQPEALTAIAKKTIERKIGARGLRSIMEEHLNHLMYEVPSDYTVEKVLITPDVINKGEPPEIVYNKDRKPVQIKLPQPKKKAVIKIQHLNQQHLAVALGVVTLSALQQPFLFQNRRICVKIPL